MHRNYRPNAQKLLLGWVSKEEYGRPGTQAVDRGGRPLYTVTVAQVDDSGSQTYRVTTAAAPPEPVPVGQRVEVVDPEVSIWTPDRENGGGPQFVIRAESIRVAK